MPNAAVPNAAVLRRRVPARVRRVALAAAALAAACAPNGPRPLDLGREACDYCRMTITDPRFGAELVTRTGKVRAFDSIECLAAYAAAQAPGDVRGVWVSDYARPGAFVAADSATFWRAGAGGAAPASPMGKGLLATRGGVAPDGVEGAGPPMRWPEVLALVAREGLERGAAHAH